MAQSRKQLTIVSPKNRAGWREWLARHQATSASVWLVVNKKSSGLPGLSLTEAVEEALCFGWIDGKLNTLDGEQYKLLFSPRKPKSIWSKSNKRRIQKLIRQGLMTPAGLEKIEAAKKNGSWDALDTVEELVVPPDLQKALHDHPTAQKNFSLFSRSSRKSLLFWIQSAKRPDTRMKRIQQTVVWAIENTKLDSLTKTEIH